MMSYYGSKLSIDDQAIPADYSIDATERVVATPYRGGAVVEFPVRRIQAVVGILIIESGGRAGLPPPLGRREGGGGPTGQSPVRARGGGYMHNPPGPRH